MKRPAEMSEDELSLSIAENDAAQIAACQVLADLKRDRTQLLAIRAERHFPWSVGSVICNQRSKEKRVVVGFGSRYGSISAKICMIKKDGTPSRVPIDPISKYAVALWEATGETITISASDEP